eukprot:903585_1
MPLDNPLTLSLQRSTNNVSIKIEKSATSNASNNNNNNASTNLEQSNNNNNASTNNNEESINSYSYRPTLHRCNAIRKYPIKITADNYVPYHEITIQFKRHSYIRYNKSVIRGYIRNLG